MELGEGLCKLRNMGFESGPFFRLEQAISAALEFIYQTQKELTACDQALLLRAQGSSARNASVSRSIKYVVGFHHLFNQNHRGAMMELGEGLCKLRNMGFESGPFFRFEQAISAALEFIYQTQKELAASIIKQTRDQTDYCLRADDGTTLAKMKKDIEANQENA